MNPDLNSLQPYPFEKLARLTERHTPPAHLANISLSIGEPRHQPPQFALDFLSEHLPELGRYPSTKGLAELRSAIASWLTTRFHLQRIDPECEILPVNGTREALFSFTQTVIDRSRDALVVSPNPFYQIYEGAALLAGAQLYFTPCLDNLNGLPNYSNIPASVWQQCQLLFVCSPGNPTGKVIAAPTLKKLIELADQHDFIIASDECYSELYRDEANPPVGLLEVCQQLGRHDYHRCVVFHSLSKRSNLPGMRSGFVAGDSKLMSAFLRYRTYHGCAMPVPTQLTSIALWQDETHVAINRDLYRQKYRKFTGILQAIWPMQIPEASFYLWPATPEADDRFAERAWAEQNLSILPGRFLGRTGRSDPQASDSLHQQQANPGEGHVRIALVATLEECEIAAERLKILFNSL